MKLYYFDITGLAEPIRLLLNHAKVPFEDIRIKREEWPSKKNDPLFEFHSMPVLVLADGTKITQSNAIMEYLGSKYGYLPTDEKSTYIIRNVMETINDMGRPAFEVFNKNPDIDAATKAKNDEKFFNEKIHIFLKVLEDTLKENCCQEYFCGKSYTIADFKVIPLMQTINRFPDHRPKFEEAFKKYPILYKYMLTRFDDFKCYYESLNIKYKFYYFDGAGRGECIRLLLRHAHIPFEDFRMKPEEFKQLKESGKFEYNQVPALEENGKMLTQSEAILHRLGLRYHYLPVNEKDSYRVFKKMGDIRDLIDSMVHFTYDSIPEEKKKSLKEKYMNDTVPLIFSLIEKDLVANECKDFLVGCNYTIADFFLIGCIRNVLTNPMVNMMDYFKSTIPKYKLLEAYLTKRTDDLYPK